MADRYSRRKLLLLSAAIGSPLIAGCTELLDEEDPTETPTPRETPTPDETPTPTPTPVGAPEILDLTVKHVDETIHVSVTVSADHDLDLVEIIVDGDIKSIENPSLDSDATEIEANLKGTLEVHFPIERGTTYNPQITVVDETGNRDELIGKTLYVPVETRPILTPYYTWYDSSRWDAGYATSPELGEYMSDDADVIQQHLDWLQRGNITTIVVSWWGPLGEPGQPNTTMFEDGILAANWPSNLDFCILYEPRNGTYGGRLEMTDGEIDLDRAENRTTLVGDFEYLSAEYFNDERYLTIDGRPVVYMWIAGALTGDVRTAFEEVFEAIPEDPYMIADLNLWGPPSLIGTEIADVFDGVTDYIMFAPEEHRDGNVPRTDSYLAALEETLQRWRLAADVAGLDFYPVVQPGFTRFGDSENRVHKRDPGIFRATCETVRHQLQAGHEGVVVTSFNEWHEDSHIEPDVVHGASYLDIVREELSVSDIDLSKQELTNLTFEYEDTAKPSEVIGTDDTRELAFMIEHLSIEDQDGDQLEFDIGGETEPVIIDGIFGAEEGPHGTFRWLGGQGKTSIFGIETSGIHNPETISIRGRGFVKTNVSVTIFDETATTEIGEDSDTYLFQFNNVG